MAREDVLRAIKNAEIAATENLSYAEADTVSSDGHLAQKNIHKSGNKNRDKAVKVVLDAFRN